MNRRKFLQEVAERVCKNVLRESNTSADIAVYNNLVIPLVKKIYPDMLTSQIADVQPITGPLGRIAALFSYYKPTAGVDLTNCRIIAVSGAQFPVGTAVTSSSGGTGTVLYTEDTGMLVKFDVGGAIAGETLNGAPIVHSTINRAAVKKIFHEYSKSNGELASANEVAFDIRTMTVEAQTCKLKTKFTPEKLQDYVNLYGESAYEIVANNLGNEITQEIDMETIDYMRSIATPYPDLILQNSYGTQGDIMAVGNDIYSNIFFAAEQIVRATKRNRTMFVLADSMTVGLLMTNPLHVTVDEEDDNPFYVGKLGTYNLYTDIYSDDHYCLIGYRGTGTGDGDTGIIYAPYVDYLALATDPQTFGTNFQFMSRYKTVRHPQDQGTGFADSDFFRCFSVDHTGLKNYPPQ